MDKEFDIALKTRIINVFEKFDDGAADAGWDLLRQKFPKKKKKRAIWWYSAAASLLLGVGLIFLLKNPEDGFITRSKTHVIRPPAGSLKSNDKMPGDVYALKTGSLIRTAKNNSKPAAEGKMVGLTDQPTNTDFKTESRLPIADSILTRRALAAIKPSSKVIAVPALAFNSAVAFPPQVGNNIPTPQKEEQNFAAVPQQVAAKIEADKKDAVLQMIARDESKLAKTQITGDRKKEKGAVLLSPYAATYFNYAKGSNNEINVGAGITSDFKLSNRFKLSTGVAIAQNTLNFGNGSIPRQLSDNAIVAAGFASAQSSTALVTNTVQASNYKANLIGLDIPINFKYQLNPKKTDTYIAAGISSGTFINERYSSTVQFSNSFLNNAGASQTQVSSNSSSFGTFDFAKTLNFSFGIGYPLGNNRLFVEPFLKYPIGGLGTQNIRFGASGINLKLNLNSQKK